MQERLPVWVSCLAALSDDLCRQAPAGLHHPPAAHRKLKVICQGSTTGHDCGGHAQTTLSYPGTAWMLEHSMANCGRTAPGNMRSMHRRRYDCINNHVDRAYTR